MIGKVGEPKGELSKIVKISKDDMPRIKPPEHSWIENDVLFEQSLKTKNLWIDSFLIYAIVWSFGSHLNEAARSEFDTFVKEMFADNEK